VAKFKEISFEEADRIRFDIQLWWKIPGFSWCKDLSPDRFRANKNLIPSLTDVYDYLVYGVETNVDKPEYGDETG